MSKGSNERPTRKKRKQHNNTIPPAVTMKLTKQEEALLNSDPLGFMVYAYLGLHPDTSVRKLAGLTTLSSSKCYKLIQQYKGNSQQNTKENTKQNSAKPDQQRRSERPENSERNSQRNSERNTRTTTQAGANQQITTQATEATRGNGLHQAFVQAFDEYYKHITGYAYNWDAKAMGGIKQLISKITADTEAVNPTASPEEIANNFKMFLSIISDSWILNNLSPTLINSKYNEIKATYGRAKQGNNANTKHGLSPLEQFQQAIRNRKR